jgi:transposase-like protein
VSWSKDKYIPYCGTCTNAASMDSGEVTDSRYRCQKFERRMEIESEH